MVKRIETSGLGFDILSEGGYGWQYFDDGERERAELERQLTRLEVTAAGHVRGRKTKATRKKALRPPTAVPPTARVDLGATTNQGKFAWEKGTKNEQT